MGGDNAWTVHTVWHGGVQQCAAKCIHKFLLDLDIIAIAHHCSKTLDSSPGTSFSVFLQAVI